MRSSDCAGAHASSSAASPANSLMLPMLCASIGAEDLGHAVDVRLAADEAGLRKAQRFRDQMLAAAESDFETDALDCRIEQRREVGRTGAADVERQMRQQVLDQVGLMRAELVALAPSEERALRMNRGTIIGWGVGVAGGVAHRSV